jgi:catechol 2,3-dioxygenase-like lactoylglutathione lyase family enzyme
MELGWSELGLNVGDVRKSLAFYQKLGFRVVDGSVETRTVTLQNGDCRIALYEGYGEGNFVNFRGGDVFAIARDLKSKGIALEREPETGADGSTGGPLIRDPDGNVLYFCHYPDEVHRV